MNNIQIKHRLTGVVLFEGESGMTMRQVLEQATTAKADLRYADLRFADLRYADFSSADLSYANLRYANLRSADLRSANLSYANLRYADLSYADLRSADFRSANLSYANLRYTDLRFANLRGKKLVGDRPFFSIGPIGSRNDYMQAWITDSGLMIQAGCFYGTKAEFESKLANEHGNNVHGDEYRSALVLIGKHTELWIPVTTETLEESS